MKIVGIYKKCIMYLCLLGFVLIMIAQPQGYGLLISAGTALIAMGTISSIVLRRDRITRMDRSLFWLLVGCLCSVSKELSVSSENIVALVCFVELPILMGVFRKRRYGGFIDLVYKVVFALSVYYIALRATPLAFRFRNIYGISNIGQLTLGLPNPNQTGIYLMVLFMIMVNATLYYSKKTVRAVLCSVCAALFFLIIETQSRASMIISGLFGIWTIFFRKVRIRRWHIIVGLLFPVVIMLFVLTGSALYSGIQVLGEAFDTGRIVIYRRIFEDTSLFSILFGRFNTFRFVNMHNVVASVFATIGLVPTAAFLYFIYQKCCLVCRSVLNERQNNALTAFLLLFMHSSMEAAVFTNGSAYAVLAAMLFLLAANRNDEREARR